MTKKQTGSSTAWVDPDDAPELTEEMLQGAEVFEGNVFVRQRGRPPSPTKKHLTSIRLDLDVMAKLREAGPGWQSQINALLRQALMLDQPQRPAEQTAPKTVHHRQPKTQDSQPKLKRATARA